MTRKPLPKVITPASAGIRRFAADAHARKDPRTAPSYDAVEPEPHLAVSAAPIANDMAPAAVAPLRTDPLAAKRRALARKTVERHGTYAAVGGLLPLPVVSIAGLTAINMRMVKQLSMIYGVPFQRDRARAAIIGLMGGAVPAGFGVATASTLAFVVPGGALVGLAVSAVSAATITRGIGMVFVEHFESAVG